MRISRHFASAAGAIGFGLVATAASAAVYNGVYVFGDSLSDIGRVAALTGDFPVPSPIPSPQALARGPLVAAGVSLLTSKFDSLLLQSLASLDAAAPRFDIKTFDVDGYMTSFIDQVKATGSYRGITDVTSPCQTTTGCNPGQTFFWDEEHPTAAIHAILGNAFAVALVPEPATYAMLFAGLGAVGWAARRRQRALL